jgi:hypothetical protein
LYLCICIDNGVLSVDPSVVCYGFNHTVMVLLCSAFHSVLFFGLPFICYKFIKESIVYTLKEDHEKRLITWELCYALHLDDNWINMNIWLSSSYSLQGSFFQFHLLIYKTLLVLIFMYLRFNFELQSLCVWLVTFAMFYRYVVQHKPYRCSSSNLYSTICLILLMINTTFGTMNALGM